MSKDWNFGFDFSPLEATPGKVDMLSARNHLDLQDPANEPFFLKRKYIIRAIT